MHLSGQSCSNRHLHRLSLTAACWPVLLSAFTPFSLVQHLQKSVAMGDQACHVDKLKILLHLPLSSQESGKTTQVYYPYQIKELRDSKQLNQGHTVQVPLFSPLCSFV